MQKSRVLVILGLALFVAGLIALIHLSTTRQGGAERQRNADAKHVLQKIREGEIADGATFAEHCGHPARIIPTGKNLSFQYPSENVMVSFARLHPRDPADLTFHIDFWRDTSAAVPLDPFSAILALHCKA